MTQRHPLELELNADARDILSAVQSGFRALVDVKGKLAEYFLDFALYVPNPDAVSFLFHVAGGRS